MNSYRARMPTWFKNYSEEIRDLTEADFRRKYGLDKTSNKWDENGDNATFEYTAGTQLTSIEEAVKFFKVDLKTWRITRTVVNKWASNTQVKLYLERRVPEEDSIIVALNEYLSNVKPVKLPKPGGLGAGLFAMADFHFGANVKGLIRTKDFNYNVLAGYLNKIAFEINESGYNEIHLSFLGDMIESFTGLNHIGVWKELESHGMKAVIGAFELIDKHLLQKIDNLASVNIVSGNHDRTTTNKGLDYEGGAAYMLNYLLKMKYPDLLVRYSSSVLSFQIGNINYITMHGHTGIGKGDMGKIVHEYGEKEFYNVIIDGHRHTREVKRAYKATRTIYKDIITVEYDALDYRKVTAPPMFTGNFYSEALGFSSTAGYIEFWEQEPKKLRMLDVTL